MGIVRKQGIVSALVIYAGFGFGALNLLILFPKFFTLQEIGLTRVLFACSSVMLHLSLLGVVPTITKFNPFYKDYLKEQKNDLYSRALFAAAFGFLCISTISWLSKDWICAHFNSTSPLFVHYFDLIYPFTFTLLVFTVLETICQVNLKTILVNTLREVGVRVLTSLIIFLAAVGLISFDIFIKLFSVVLYGVPALILIFYLYINKHLTLTKVKSRVTERLSSRMIQYALFSYSGVIIFVLSQQADTILIADLIDLRSVGIYATADYIATLIQVPARSLAGIVMPLFAIAWKDRKLDQVETLYKKTALNQLIAGLFIFGIVWSCIDYLLAFMGQDYAYAKTIIAVLGLSRLLDLAFGPNNELLSTSSYWKFNFYSLVLLMAIFLPTNYFFIKLCGPVGASYSNLLSFTCFNVSRWIFIYRKFKFQPFSIEFFKVIVPFVIAIGAGYCIPNFELNILTPLLKSLTFFVLASIAMLWLKPSEDIENLKIILIKTSRKVLGLKH